jgi:hypothetical protein
MVDTNGYQTVTDLDLNIWTEEGEVWYAALYRLFLDRKGMIATDTQDTLYHTTLVVPEGFDMYEFLNGNEDHWLNYTPGADNGLPEWLAVQIHA